MVILSPTLRITAASIWSSSGLVSGNGLMLGPRSTSAASASAAGSGAMIPSSLMRNLSGCCGCAIGGSVVGSVIKPVSADAAAVSGLTRYTCPSLVPERPRKFLLNVLRLTPFEFGENPIPIHGPHAHSSILAPASIMSVSAPLSAIMESTCLDPGDIPRLTLSAILCPFKTDAVLVISANEEFVHEPIAT